MSKNNRGADFDRYDIAILSALATNNRLTTVELATVVHLSRTAVSRRITSLKRAGVLSSAAEVLNYELLGFGVRAIVDVNAPSHTAESLRKELLREAEVLGVSVIAGDGLLSLDIIATNMDHLHRFVASLQKRGQTTTKIVFSRQPSALTLVERMRAIDQQAEKRLVSG